MTEVQVILIVVLSLWCQRFWLAQCACNTVNISDRIGVVRFSTKSFDNKNCRWSFQPPPQNNELILILKFFFLHQEPEGAEYIVLPNGQTISSSLHSQSQLCRSFANERTKANRCWREKNWSNCPHQSINQTMWPPTLFFSDDEITSDFELEFGLMYVYVDCKSIERSPSTTGLSTMPSLPTSWGILSTGLPPEASEIIADSNCDLWMTILFAVGSLSIATIGITCFLLCLECRKKKVSDDRTEKLFRLELATNVASTSNSENIAEISTARARSCDNIYEQLPVNCEVENDYSSVPATVEAELVSNVLYQA